MFKITEKEKDALREEFDLLKELLDIHVQNPDIWRYNEKGFEEYVNAVLDRINEIKQQLNESSLP